MKIRRKIGFLTILSIILIVLFIFIGLNSSNFEYFLYRRVPKVIAIILTGGAIAFSSMIFQTITNNRILTPSVLGLDSLYMFIQTFVVFALGSKNLAVINSNLNFIISIGLMIIFSALLYTFLFKREENNIFFLLLVGLILGTFFQSLSSFMQMLIDPNEFSLIQDKMFASFNNINTNILILSSIIILSMLIYTHKYTKVLDTISLGKEHAINLGVDYDNVVRKMLVIVAILVSVSTALVGPITFLGLLVVNLAREFLNTYKHKYLIITSILISIVALMGGQLIIERIFNFSMPISVIINFIGGFYFIYLLLKENKV
ncbi:iron chelate uptake ABC transporter family permease subunit [Tissierella sp. MSJ-40]|uniref:Iron chelate uptake ABC transporter family permease subunit n=1 Tax=Tissierella simiarum TaxID=2841534 RepID=A0ABS6E2J3_9FIRM|nr:iron chelate uptake ABC transporter family permease subunit [Tissierella simiarum]MBU5437131.1 iron chelate uptake ABC transporter family permease subunit [Tissierella simiarum]